jgi:hypothetical protein
MMARFQHCINVLALKEVYLYGRTWFTLVHLDRILCTADLEELVGECNLSCLASVVSDHSPPARLPPSMPAHRRFHFEDYWLRLEDSMTPVPRLGTPSGTQIPSPDATDASNG